MAFSVAGSVEQARQGNHPRLVARMQSGWLVLADNQLLEGYCILIRDPLVPSLNHLSKHDASTFLFDMTLAGAALMTVLGATRMNYEILGNSDPYLHAHIIPRFSNEPEPFRSLPIWYYDLANTKRDLSTVRMAEILQAIRLRLLQEGGSDD